MKRELLEEKKDRDIIYQLYEYKSKNKHFYVILMNNITDGQVSEYGVYDIELEAYEDYRGLEGVKKWIE